MIHSRFFIIDWFYNAKLRYEFFKNVFASLRWKKVELFARNDVSVCHLIVTTLRFRWNSTGSTVAGSSNGASSTSLNRLDRPFSVVLDSSETLYIADQQNHRVVKWLKGASAGTTIAGQASGSSGFGLSDLNQPSAVTLDSSGNIYVSDTSNNRVQLWSNLATSGTTVAGTLGRETFSWYDFHFLWMFYDSL